MKIAKLFFLCAISQSVFAGGFQINTQSIKGIGLAGSFTGLSNDASAAFFNPGAMGMLDKKINITLGDVLIAPHTSYLSPYTGNVNMENQLFFPFQVYGVYKLKKIAIGLSINNPYGLGTKWDYNWEGRYVTQEVVLKTFYFQPTVSYNITDNIGVGAGFVYATGNAEVYKAAQNTGSSDVLAQLKGKGNGFGFNIGAMFKFGEHTKLGIDFRSAVNVELENGDAAFSNVPGSLNENIPSATTFNSGIKLPYTLSAGFSTKANEKILLTADINYTGWNSFDSLNFLFPEYPELDSRNERNYKNVIAVRFGIQYSFNDKTDFRAGIAFDQSPVQDGYLSPDLPDANKMAYTLGISYKMNTKFSIDAGYAFENFNERTGTYKSQAFSGTYKTKLHVIGIGLNFNF